MGPSVLKWGIRWLWLHSFLLVITGVFLIFFYRPTAADAWDDIFALQNEVTASIALRNAHQWLSWLWVPSALVVGLIALAERARKLVVLVVAAVAAGLFAGLSGLFLPWDQLALRSVTVGTDIRGYTAAFDEDVRFALINGVEVSTSTLRRWFLGHLAAGFLAFAMTAAMLFTRRRSSLRLSTPDIEALG